MKGKKRSPHRGGPGPQLHSHGLSSAINRQWVVQILNNSTREDIAAVLQQVGFRPPPEWAVLSKAERRAELERRILADLATASGQNELARLRREILEREAHRWLRSEDGLSQLLELKTALLAGQVAADEDLCARACREALAGRVERWLKSPLGQEAIEQERQRAARSQNQPPARRKGDSWIHAAVNEIK